MVSKRQDAEPDEGFRGPQVCSLVGITYRQLDYWARTGLLRPSITDANGSGTQRRYSYGDVIELKVIKQLLDAGLKLQQARQAVECLRGDLGADLASANSSWPARARCSPTPTARWSTCWPAARASSTSSPSPGWSRSSTPPSWRSGPPARRAAAVHPPGGRVPGRPRGRRALTTPADLVGGAVAVHPRFAHESERRFARILDFYGVPWEYEPVEFVLAVGRRRSADGGVPPGLLASGAGSLRGAHHPQPAAGDEEERQGPPAPPALPGRPGEDPLPAGHPRPPGEVRPRRGARGTAPHRPLRVTWTRHRDGILSA